MDVALEIVGATASVPHQKRLERNEANAIEPETKINEADRYSAAHNVLVAGSRPGDSKYGQQRG
jgi:hypothetical protein